MTDLTPEETIQAAHRGARPSARRAAIMSVMGWSLGLIGAIQGWLIVGLLGMGIFLAGWTLFAITWYRVVTLRGPERRQ